MRVPDSIVPGSTILSTATKSQSQYTVDFFRARLKNETDLMQVEHEGRRFRLTHRSPRILSSTPRLFSIIAMNLDCTCLIFCSNSFAQVSHLEVDDSLRHKINKNDSVKIQTEVKRALEQGMFYDLVFIENDENINEIIRGVKEISPKTAVIVFLPRNDTTNAEELRNKGINTLEAYDLHNEPLADFYIAQALGDEGIKALEIV